jgi:uncharacterized C2H2 Zn-finger protein
MRYPVLEHMEQAHNGEEHSVVNQFKCDYCNCKILSQDYLENHVASVHGGKKPMCTICDTTFLKERHLIRHMRNVHKQNLLYNCHICDVKCSRKGYLKAHIETVHEGKKQFNCEICDSAFTTKQGLNRHISTIHEGNKSNKSIKEKLWPCPMCEKSFTQAGTVNAHIDSVHDGIKLFECQDCALEFYTEQAKDNHVKKEHEHDKKKSYICELCEYSCDFSYELKSHILSIHTVGNSFKCAICDVFSCDAKSKLQKHIEGVHGKIVPLDSL